MPPEQLVDVPVPQIPERPGRRELLWVLRRLEEVEEVTRLREQNALLAEEEVDEDEEEEELEVSRFLPHFRSRRWCWYVQVGGICLRGWQCTFAHHESELPSRLMVVQCGGGSLVSGSRGLASPGPFFGAPAGPRR